MDWPTITWDPVPGAGNYEVDISNSPSPSTQAAQSVVPAFTFKTPTLAHLLWEWSPGPATRWWRVRAIQATAGPSASPWTAWRSFTVTPSGAMLGASEVARRSGRRRAQRKPPVRTSRGSRSSAGRPWMARRSIGSSTPRTAQRSHPGGCRRHLARASLVQPDAVGSLAGLECRRLSVRGRLSDRDAGLPVTPQGGSDPAGVDVSGQRLDTGAGDRTDDLVRACSAARSGRDAARPCV